MTQQGGINLIDRVCTINIGTVSISGFGLGTGLDAWFSVKRSIKPKEPCTCDLRLYNLAPSTRAKIESYTQVTQSTAQAPTTKGQTLVPVEIIAGYAGNTSTIFLGEMRSAQTSPAGCDMVTELITGDSDQAGLLARSTVSFTKGSNAYIVATKLLADMGCGAGNIATVANVLKAAPLFSHGYVLKGSSRDHLINLATSCGLEVKLVGGIAQWMTRGQPIGGDVYSLSSSTGLIGAPSCDTKGVCSAAVLMLPGLAPGQSVVMAAKFITGPFRITSMETKGDTAGADWGHSLEMKRPGIAP